MMIQAKSRTELLEEARAKKEKKVIEDYSLMDEEGNFVFTIREVAAKNKIALPTLYKILTKYGIIKHQKRK